MRCRQSYTHIKIYNFTCVTIQQEKVEINGLSIEDIRKIIN